MSPAWWMFVGGFVAGTFAGAFTVGLCSAGKRADVSAEMLNEAFRRGASKRRLQVVREIIEDNESALGVGAMTYPHDGDAA